MNSYSTIDIGRLVRAHGPMLERSARKLGFGEADVQDLVQSVWLTFVDGWRRFERRSSVQTFLYGILRNKARELWRARNNHSTGPMAQGAYSLESDLLDRERVSVLEDCVSGLGANFRETVALELEGVPKKEAAARLGVPVNQLYVLFHRAKHHLIDCMALHFE